MKRVKLEKLLEDENLLNEFIKEMSEGAVSIIPTDTLYGFAVAANNPLGVQRVYEIKGRDNNKPLILFLHHKKELVEMGFDISLEGKKLLAEHWPGALTAIFPRPDSHLISAFTFDNIGVRIPKHYLLLDLLSKLPIKLLTTSANRSGTEFNKSLELMEKEFGSEMDWLIDGGELEEVTPSTVVDLSSFPYKVLRQGKIAL